MRGFPPSLRGLMLGVLVVFVAFAGWAVAMILAAFAGFRLASSVSDPEPLAIVVQQWNDLIIPFLPAATLSGALLGYWMRGRSLSDLAAGLLWGAAAVASYSATMVAVFIWGRRAGGGYAAEQGMDALLLLVGPILGLTALPFWIAAGVVLRRVLSRS